MSPQRAPMAVLDASAVLAFIFDERGAGTVEKVLPHAVITAANMTEVLYRANERGYTTTGSRLQEMLLDLGLSIEPVTGDDCARAAELIGQSRTPTAQIGSLSLGDGLCIAVGERLDLPIVGGDQDWETLQLNVTYAPFR